MLSIKKDKRKKSKDTYPKTSEALLLACFHRKKPMAYDAENKRCCYDPTINGGCVIGTWLRKSVDVDSLETISAMDIPDKDLPKAWREGKMPRPLLDSLQEIHDDRKCWENPKTAKTNSYGLIWNKTGILRFADIVKKYKLKVVLKDEISKSKKSVR